MFETRPILRIAAAAATAVMMSAAPGTHAADPYPTRPVRMIVPFAPGGGSDIVGRIVGQALGEQWNQAVVIDNRPGGGSTIGAGIAAKSPADGYTCMVSSSAIVFSRGLYKGLPFELTRDFKPVSLLARQPSMLVVNQSVKANDIKQMIELAKAQPGKFTFGSAGVGSATHLGGELLRASAGMDLLHVPYKSAGQAMSAVLSGEVQVLITNMATVLPHVKSGRVRTLGISSMARSPLAPDIPTVDEGGLKGFEYDTWYAMLVPAGVPSALLNRIYGDLKRAVDQPATQKQFKSAGITPVASSPDELKAFIASEIKKWDPILRGVKIGKK